MSMPVSMLTDAAAPSGQYLRLLAATSGGPMLSQEMVRMRVARKSDSLWQRIWSTCLSISELPPSSCMGLSGQTFAHAYCGSYNFIWPRSSPPRPWCLVSPRFRLVCFLVDSYADRNPYCLNAGISASNFGLQRRAVKTQAGYFLGVA